MTSAPLLWFISTLLGDGRFYSDTNLTGSKCSGITTYWWNSVDSFAGAYKRNFQLRKYGLFKGRSSSRLYYLSFYKTINIGRMVARASIILTFKKVEKVERCLSDQPEGALVTRTWSKDQPRLASRRKTKKKIQHWSNKGEICSEERTGSLIGRGSPGLYYLSF